MSCPKQKLTPIPANKKKRRPGPAEAKPPGGASQQPASPVTSAAPDLSYIAPNLRAHAVPVEQVAFFVDNPRKHGEADLDATRASLKRFGQVELLVVNRRENPPVVLNGNGRLQAALSLGWSHIAVNFIDVDRATANALAITLNRTGELAEWDKDKVDKALRDIDTGNDPVLDALMDQLATEIKIVPKDGEADQAADASPQLGAIEYRLIVECRDEGHQAELLARFQAEGLPCKVLIS